MKKIINLCFILCTMLLIIGCTRSHIHEYVDGKCTCGQKETKVYTVVFKDIDGNVIKSEEVEENQSATAPEVKDGFGYTFIGWDKEFSKVTSDLEVNAVYDLMEFTVKFYGFYGELLKTEKVLMKQSATAPEAPEVPYHEFSKWSMDFSSVEFNIEVRAQYVPKMETYEISNVNYWLQELSKKYNIYETIMTTEDINTFNQLAYSDYDKTEVVDVCLLANSVPGDTVDAMINVYSNMNKYTVYNNETKSSLTTWEKNDILANRNLENIPDTVNVKFGLVVDFGWLRSYPTNHYSNNYEMDRFQETSLNVGEGVAIYHESSDGNWYFVQAENYNGWIEKKYIAVCSYNDMCIFLKATDRLVVISDYVEIKGAYVRMGQSFPLISIATESYQILFPKRTQDGKLEVVSAFIEPSNDYSVGYLEYTYENMIKQAFKLLGIDYSWGDKNKDGRDCSSTMNAIYRSFGFVMPRNTSNQLAIPTHGLRVSGLSTVSIKKYHPGTMIFSSSHVMLYIGEDAEGNPYLLHNTTSGDGACILQSLQSYGGNKMIAVLRPYNLN